MKSLKAIWFSRSGEGYRRGRQRELHKKEECAERPRGCVAEKGKKKLNLQSFMIPSREKNTGAPDTAHIHAYIFLLVSETTS